MTCVQIFPQKSLHPSLIPDNSEAVILVPKARGNPRLARANQGSLLYGYFSLRAKPPEMCGGEKLYALGRIGTYNLQNEPADSKH